MTTPAVDPNALVMNLLPIAGWKSPMLPVKNRFSGMQRKDGN